MSLFGRVWTITADDKRIEGLRCSFAVKKTLKKEPNTLDLTISNLSEETRGHLKKSGIRVILEGGYKGSSGVLFVGTSRDIFHQRKGSDWETVIRCGDGELAFTQARLNRSYPKGVTGREVILDLAKAMGLNVNNGAAGLLASSQALVRGYVASGSAADSLSDITKANGLEWSIQNEQLQIVDRKLENGQLAIKLNSETGLIGSPEHSAPDKKKTKPSVLVKALMNHEFIPGRVVVLDALDVKGEFVIVEVTHNGDSHGQDWTSSLELTARDL